MKSKVQPVFKDLHTKIMQLILVKKLFTFSYLDIQDDIQMYIQKYAGLMLWLFKYPTESKIGFSDYSPHIPLHPNQSAYLISCQATIMNN